MHQLLHRTRVDRTPPDRTTAAEPATATAGTARATLRRSKWLAALTVPAALVSLLLSTGTAYANIAVTRVSTDPYTSDAQAQHRTEVEPDTFSFGTTIVSAFQVGRVFGGGSSNIGFATSTNGGANWTSGFLPRITTVAGGPYGQASDPGVAFDAKHNVWLISTLGIRSSSVDVLTSRSTDGTTWSNPITTATGQLDKNWIVCDNTPSSPFFGNCYTQYDISGSGDAIRLKTSSDGGLTWGPARTSSSNPAGLGGQPVVLPNGTVIVPYLSTSDQIRSFRSVDGGQSWRATVLVSSISHHTVAGGLREETLPSAEVDGIGTVYVAWSDCRFRSGCPRNDIVVSKSTSETTWAAPVRVPIDPTTSSVEHFIPGIGVDKSSSGASARVGLTYYYYPNSSCTSATCQLDVGFISSVNGGSSWSIATQIQGPMNLSWLPNTSQGRMLGDYISTSVFGSGGRAYPVIPVAHAPTGSTFDLAMYVPSGGLAVTGGAQRATAAGASPATGASTSDVNRVLTAN